MANASLLVLDNVSKRFGPVEALRGIDLELDRGTVLGLVGDNGAGKSTLMKCVAGACRPDAGEVRFEGSVLSGRDSRDIRRRGIEMIHQDLALSPQQDVAANIFLGREPTRRLVGLPLGVIDQAKIEREAQQIIARLGAPIPSLRHPVGRLSTGQQQSVAIARALTATPKLVIMDEPTAALAVREVDLVLELIRELKRQGIAVILTSHELANIFAVCDRIVALRRGRIIADEPTAGMTMNNLVAHIVGSG
jgi:simple sugar transport system ATP-binding protein